MTGGQGDPDRSPDPGGTPEHGKPEPGTPEPGTPEPGTVEPRSVAEDGRRFSPSAARNRDAIRDVVLRHIPGTGHVLEIASGTGEHGAHVIAGAPHLRWTYSDLDADCLRSQAAWQAHSQATSLLGPFLIDTRSPDWGEAERAEPYDAVFSANMIHIAPFAAARGLMAGAGRVLSPTGCLILYGPFGRDGQMAASNAAFDASLKARDPDWGVRDLDLDIVPLAQAQGLALGTVIEMPANNLCVIFRRA